MQMIDFGQCCSDGFSHYRRAKSDSVACFSGAAYVEMKLYPVRQLLKPESMQTVGASIFSVVK